MPRRKSPRNRPLARKISNRASQKPTRGENSPFQHVIALAAAQKGKTRVSWIVMAFRSLKHPHDIERFMREYTHYLQQTGVPGDPFEIDSRIDEYAEAAFGKTLQKNKIGQIWRSIIQKKNDHYRQIAKREEERKARKGKRYSKK